MSHDYVNTGYSTDKDRGITSIGFTSQCCVEDSPNKRMTITSILIIDPDSALSPRERILFMDDAVVDNYEDGRDIHFRYVSEYLPRHNQFRESRKLPPIKVSNLLVQIKTRDVFNLR